MPFIPWRICNVCIIWELHDLLRVAGSAGHSYDLVFGLRRNHWDLSRLHQHDLCYSSLTMWILFHACLHGAFVFVYEHSSLNDSLRGCHGYICLFGPSTVKCHLLLEFMFQRCGYVFMSSSLIIAKYWEYLIMLVSVPKIQIKTGFYVFKSFLN